MYEICRNVFLVETIWLAVSAPWPWHPRAMAASYHEANFAGHPIGPCQPCQTKLDSSTETKIGEFRMNQAAIEELKKLSARPLEHREPYAANQAVKRIFVMGDKLPIMHQVLSA